MDPVTAVGLVASVIQLATFTKDVVTRAKSFVSETEEIPAALKFLHRRIPLLLLILGDINDQITLENPPPSRLSILTNIIEPCSEELQNLNEILGQMLPMKGESRSEKIKKAFTSLKSDSRIRRAAKTIDIYLSDLKSYQITRNTSQVNQILQQNMQVSPLSLDPRIFTLT